MRLDLPAPLGPITEVKLRNGPIVWWPLYGIVGIVFGEEEGDNIPVRFEVAYFYANERHLKTEPVGRGGARRRRVASNTRLGTSVPILDPTAKATCLIINKFSPPFSAVNLTALSD
jgi:hypothetical protein